MTWIRFIFSVLLITLVMTACSDEPVQMGPFHGRYHCDLLGLDFTNTGDYDRFCTEEFAESRRILDSISKNIANETYIEKDCKIDEIRFLSKFWETTETFQIKVIKTSYSFSITGVNHDDSYLMVLSIDKYSTYECMDSLDFEKIVVLKEPSCNDTLSVKSIIDFFDKQPDEKCTKL